MKKVILDPSCQQFNDTWINDSYAFLYPINNYWLSAYCVPGTILDANKRPVKEAAASSTFGVYFLLGMDSESMDQSGNNQKETEFQSRLPKKILMKESD